MKLYRHPGMPQHCSDLKIAPAFREHPQPALQDLQEQKADLYSTEDPLRFGKGMIMQRSLSRRHFLQGVLGARTAAFVLGPLRVKAQEERIPDPTDDDYLFPETFQRISDSKSLDELLNSQASSSFSLPSEEIEQLAKSFPLNDPALTDYNTVDQNPVFLNYRGFVDNAALFETASARPFHITKHQMLLTYPYDWGKSSENPYLSIKKIVPNGSNISVTSNTVYVADPFTGSANMSFSSTERRNQVGIYGNQAPSTIDLTGVQDLQNSFVCATSPGNGQAVAYTTVKTNLKGSDYYLVQHSNESYVYHLVKKNPATGELDTATPPIRLTLTKIANLEMLGNPLSLDPNDNENPVNIDLYGALAPHKPIELTGLSHLNAIGKASNSNDQVTLQHIENSQADDFYNLSFLQFRHKQPNGQADIVRTIPLNKTPVERTRVVYGMKVGDTTYNAKGFDYSKFNLIQSAYENNSVFFNTANNQDKYSNLSIHFQPQMNGDKLIPLKNLYYWMGQGDLKVEIANPLGGVGDSNTSFVPFDALVDRSQGVTPLTIRSDGASTANSAHSVNFLNIDVKNVFDKKTILGDFLLPGTQRKVLALVNPARDRDFPLIYFDGFVSPEAAINTPEQRHIFQFRNGRDNIQFYATQAGNNETATITIREVPQPVRSFWSFLPWIGK